MSVNRNIFFTFLTQVPTLLLGVISGIFITRMIGAQGVGTYALIQNNLELFTLVLSFSLNSAVVYFVSSKKIPEGVLAGISVLFLGGGTILLLFILTGVYFFDKGGLLIPAQGSRGFYVLYLACAFLFSIANAFISAFFQGRSLFRFVNTMQLFNSIMNFTCYGIAFVAWKFFDYPVRIDLILGIALLVLVTNSALWLYFYFRNFTLHPTFSFSFADHIRPLFVFIFIGHLSHIINFLNYRLDVWIVNHYNTPVDVGLYTRAAGIAQMFWLISNPISNVLVPYLTNHANKDRVEVFSFLSKVNTTAVLLLTGCAALLAPWLFPLVYGDEFSASVLPFHILLPAIWVSCINKLFSVYVYSEGKVKYNLYTTIIGLAVTVALDFILIPRYGIAGAAWATLATYVAIFIATLCFTFGSLKLPAGNYFLLGPGDVKKMRKKVMALIRG